MTSMELTDGRATTQAAMAEARAMGRDRPHNFGDTMAVAIAQVQRMRASHAALLVVARWCVSHEHERLADYPEVLAKVRAVIERAEGG